jgi:hypothetical protein
MSVRRDSPLQTIPLSGGFVRLRLVVPFHRAASPTAVDRGGEVFLEIHKTPSMA